MANISDVLKKLNQDFEVCRKDTDRIARIIEKYHSSLLSDLPIEYSKNQITFVSLGSLSNFIVRMVSKIEIFSETDAKELLNVVMKDAESLIEELKHADKKSD